MPQLDVTTYSTQIFWLLLCFCTMFLIAKMFILPRMDNVFNNRLRHINSLLDQASELSKEAKKIDKETSDFVENAKIDIAMQEEKAIRSFNENIEKMQEDLNKKNAENSAIALASIDKSIQELSNELEKKVPEMAALACNIMYPEVKGE